MKTIGLLGGMSWESSVNYYKIINETVNSELGGHHSATCVLYSVDFQEIEQYQFSNQWEKSAERLTHACQALERANADYIVICTNTMHKVAKQIQPHLKIPIIHIAEVTAQALKEARMTKVGLLGTKFTMEENFYKSIIEQAGIEVMIPAEQARKNINDIIYNELVLGKIEPDSKKFYLNVIDELHQQGAEGIILGCTEIGLLIQQKDTKIPLFDTTEIHAIEAATLSLKS